MSSLSSELGSFPSSKLMVVNSPSRYGSRSPGFCSNRSASTIVSLSLKNSSSRSPRGSSCKWSIRVCQILTGHDRTIISICAWESPTRYITALSLGSTFGASTSNDPRSILTTSWAPSTDSPCANLLSEYSLKINLQLGTVCSKISNLSSSTGRVDKNSSLISTYDNPI